MCVNTMMQTSQKWSVSPRSDWATLRETAKSPRAASQTLQSTVSMVNVKAVGLSKQGLVGRVTRGKTPVLLLEIIGVKGGLTSYWIMW